MSNFDHDPVGDLFAREREQVVSQDGDDLHWQSIVRRSRTQRRSRFFGYTVGVAAAALVIGGVSYGAVLRDDGAAPVNAATDALRTAVSTPGPIASGERTPGDTPTMANSAPAPVPKSFAPLSVTNAGGGSMFVLGSASCGSARCPALIGSTDTGRSWHLLSSFTSNTLPTASTSEGAVQSANALSQVRFASARVGWVFGGDIQVTTDGGRTFRPYGHLGETVIDVETDGNQVIVTSADLCAKSVCSGAVHVARALVTEAGAPDEVGGVPMGGQLADLEVFFDRGTAYVSPSWKSAPPGDFGPRRIALGGGSMPMAKLGASCGNPSEQNVIATADPKGGLFAFCAAVGGGAAGSTGMAVFSSANQGTSWSPVSSDVLLLVNAGDRSFAAASPKDLLAVSGGSPDLHGSMKVSSDGGKTWHEPKSPPPMPTNGWAWVGAPGGGTFYAVSKDAAPAFWKSDDSGETWTKVGLTS